MPFRFDIYIGSDNGTRKICDDYLLKIKKWADETFPSGYTLIKGLGFYNGNSEESILINVFLDYAPSLRHRLEELKQELKQNSILLVKSTVDLEFI